MNIKNKLLAALTVVVFVFSVACGSVMTEPILTDGQIPLPQTSESVEDNGEKPAPESPSAGVEVSSQAQNEDEKPKPEFTVSKSEKPESKPKPESKSESKESKPENKPESKSEAIIEQPSSESVSVNHNATVPTDEVRSIWISFLEYENILTNKSETQFTKSIAQQFDVCRDFGLNTIVVQVRPFGDAIYKSEYFPSSYLFSGSQGGIGDEPFDALSIMIREARKRNLRIEAWINPYRVTKDKSWSIHKENPASAMLKTGDAVEYGGKITYNPASTAAQDLIVAGVYELVKNYDIDAIHFDDYFYPTTDADFDRDQFEIYKKMGGEKNLAQWRRDNVTNLMRRVHDTIKSVNKNILFGIAPQGNNDNNLNNQYVDVKALINEGLIDYLCPQMYFGFDNQACPYSETLRMFNDMAKNKGVKIYTGLATYKFGKEDSWAGKGKTEWIGTKDILARQVNDARNLSEYGGFILFRYDTTFNYKDYYANNPSVFKQVEAELKNLKAII